MARLHSLREWDGAKRKPLQASLLSLHFFPTNPGLPRSSAPFQEI
jgi:hypothetical protein